MTEHVETFFKTVVFGGVALGVISLGLGLYCEFFRKVGKRQERQYHREDYGVTQRRK